MRIQNAKITGTMLGFEDHGIFTFMISLDYGGSGQGAGGYALDGWDEKTKSRKGWKFGIDFISRILAVVGVETWESLPGKSIRVKSDFNKVLAIGNFLEENWLDFDEFMAGCLDEKDVEKQ